MASGSDYAHAVTTARVGRVETGGQGAIPEETAGGVRFLWHHDQVRYVPACGTLPLGFGSVVWKGAPQDLMDHVRGSHRVPEEVQHIKLETLIPPWTVTRQVYMDSLTGSHSGISNDILLFSDIGLSLTHHYMVHKRGVPHVAFRINYMSQLRALLPLPAVPLTEGRSPDPGSSSVGDSPDVVSDSSQPSRRTLLAGA